MRAFKKMGMAASLVALGLMPLAALALSRDSSGAMGAGFFGVFCCVYIAIYVYFALCIYKIAQKCGVEMAWLAWIPIVQIVPFIQAGKKPVWWIILMLIPIVNFVVWIIVGMAVAEQRGKPSWLGILLIVPLVNLFVIGYLAFSD